jgi:hypothetical protein
LIFKRFSALETSVLDDQFSKVTQNMECIAHIGKTKNHSIRRSLSYITKIKYLALRLKKAVLLCGQEINPSDRD